MLTGRPSACARSNRAPATGAGSRTSSRTVSLGSSSRGARRRPVAALRTSTRSSTRSPALLDQLFPSAYSVVGTSRVQLVRLRVACLRDPNGSGADRSRSQTKVLRRVPIHSARNGRRSTINSWTRPRSDPTWRPRTGTAAAGMVPTATSGSVGRGTCTSRPASTGRAYVRSELRQRAQAQRRPA